MPDPPRIIIIPSIIISFLKLYYQHLRRALWQKLLPPTIYSMRLHHPNGLLYPLHLPTPWHQMPFLPVRRKTCRVPHGSFSCVVCRLVVSLIRFALICKGKDTVFPAHSQTSWAFLTLIKRFFVVNDCEIRKNVLSLQRLNRNNYMKKILVNEKEEELLAAIRNYRNAFPRGNPQLLWYAQQLFDELTEPPAYYSEY